MKFFRSVFFSKFLDLPFMVYERFIENVCLWNLFEHGSQLSRLKVIPRKTISIQFYNDESIIEMKAKIVIVMDRFEKENGTSSWI